MWLHSTLLLLQPKCKKTQCNAALSLGPTYCLLWWNYSTRSLMKNILSIIHSLWVQYETAQRIHSMLIYRVFLLLGQLRGFAIDSVFLSIWYSVFPPVLILSNTYLDIFNYSINSIKYSFQHSLEESQLSCFSSSPTNRSKFPFPHFCLFIKGLIILKLMPKFPSVSGVLIIMKA